MAQKIAQSSSDREILIGVPVGPVLKGLLHPKLKIPDEMIKEKDEFHLIMEYPKGERYVTMLLLWSYLCSINKKSCLVNDKTTQVLKTFDKAKLIPFAYLFRNCSIKEVFWNMIKGKVRFPPNAYS